MNGRDSAVVVDGLTRRFGDLVAVDRLSFSVGRGELFGLVGPDGAGKTTTLRMLAGVVRPSTGDARINGVSVATDPEGVKPSLAYMSQRFGLYTDLTVSENLDFYADLYLVPKSDRPARLERLYAFSNLGPFRDRLAGQLSGGMKQKLGLSCALIHEPVVLLLDEPTFGVDPVSRRDLWLIVHEMVARGVTVIVSTSYMDEAERFDRLAFLHQGRVLAIDTPAAMRLATAGEILAVRVDRARDAQRFLATQRLVLRVTMLGEYLHLSVHSAGRDGPVIADSLRRDGFSVAAVERVDPSMEDVFIDLAIRAQST